MNRQTFAKRVIASRRTLVAEQRQPLRKSDAEGGCGVIGIACSEQIAGRHLLQALAQMRNRGNGKGGGIAAAGLEPAFFGASPEIFQRDYLLAVALIDPAIRKELEATFITPTFIVDHVFDVPTPGDFRSLHGLDVRPPDVVCYFVRVRPDVRSRWVEQHRIAPVSDPTVGADPEGCRPAHRVVVGGLQASEAPVAADLHASETQNDADVDDEIVYQNSYRLNRTLYASLGEKKAFVLSHGKDLLVLKMVGYGDDVVRYYRLEDLRGHVWIGHHRYPTKGKVWHPGGAHPFIGMHEALVHNGDFANYASISSYLAQRNISPLFLTDTEVAVLVFDLLHRLYGYPLEYVIEAMAPTTERDFRQLPPDRRRIYEMLQTVHMHGSPDGPWFFLLAQSNPRTRACRLIGITDTSMLRPQVFALQSGESAIGFAASEKQAIDAALESLAREDARFWTRADRYWNARGGSHTDGGAFLFTVEREFQASESYQVRSTNDEVRSKDDRGVETANQGLETGDRGPETGTRLICTDKFGRVITPAPHKKSPISRGHPAAKGIELGMNMAGASDALFAEVASALPGWSFDDLEAFLSAVEPNGSPYGNLKRAIDVLTRLLDCCPPTGTMKRSGVLARIDASLSRMFESVRKASSPEFIWIGRDCPVVDIPNPDITVIVEARGYPPEGPESLAREIVKLYERGARRFILANVRGHRFIGCGLGADSYGVRIDVYGSSGDYLASGIDGADIIVHGSAQDQLAQILKGGRLVVYGDVGQTFMYGAKGGTAFILGNAAGRPLINAVGKPRVIINGTCLDYLAESFMAGDPLDGGGFVVLNAIVPDEDGILRDLATPYPGGNLFSLASGGAIYVRDPHRTLEDDQLNGGAFSTVSPSDWMLIKPYLDENEALFGIPVNRLLEVDGATMTPERVYRKILPSGHKALAPEEAWVGHRAAI